MSELDLQPVVSLPPRCVACGEPIGAYEHAVHVRGVIARHTSRAADPGFDLAGDGERFHGICFAARGTLPATGQ